MGEIDPDQLRLPDRLVLPRNGQSGPPRHRKGERFLCGPIPLAWINIAMNLPGRSWHVATVIWFLAGLQRSSTVKLEYQAARDAGLDRHVVYRGLTNLERARLIDVERGQGRCPLVTLLEVPIAEDDS